jgi:rubrerythrin
MVVMKTNHAKTHVRRRLVGLERSYECASCGTEHRSWSRLRACPACGARLAVAVIRRAALAGA